MKDGVEDKSTDTVSISDLSRFPDALPAPFVVYDPDERIIVCNSAYRQAYSPCDHKVGPGVSHTDKDETRNATRVFNQEIETQANATAACNKTYCQAAWRPNSKCITSRTFCLPTPARFPQPKPWCGGATRSSD